MRNHPTKIKFAGFYHYAKRLQSELDQIFRYLSIALANVFAAERWLERRYPRPLVAPIPIVAYHRPFTGKKLMLGSVCAN